MENSIKNSKLFRKIEAGDEAEPWVIIPGCLIISSGTVSGTRKPVEEAEEGMAGDRGACPASSWRTVDSSLALEPRSPWRRFDRRRRSRDSLRMILSKYPSKTPTRAQTL